MEHTRVRASRKLSLALSIVVVLLATLAPFGGATGNIYAQGTSCACPSCPPGYGCLGDFLARTTCTAQDVRIKFLHILGYEHACTQVGDTATVYFQVEMQPEAQTRCDISIFIAQDGESAQDASDIADGSYDCVHDYLKPVGSPVDATSGVGPFLDADSDPVLSGTDVCGDIEASVTTFYNLAAITLPCVDGNEDSIVDDLGACLGWEEPSASTTNNCFGYAQACPGGTAKCNCRSVPTDPPMIIYRGYDWGDLPDTYHTISASDGARHAIQDPDGDGTLDTVSYDNSDPGYPDYVIPAVWLGQSVDYSPLAESDGLPSPDATGDDADGADDENGVTILDSTWHRGADGGNFRVTVGSSNDTCQGCRLGFWIDWNLDGDFSEANETYVHDVQAGVNDLTFDTPDIPLPSTIYARFRLYDQYYVGQHAADGTVANGEVEDTVFEITPTAIDLLGFEATSMQQAIRLGWETATEIDNLGFNLYRATWVAGDRTQINPELIPALWPGSPLGGVYEYVDTGVSVGTEYFYWLETLDLKGHSTLVGPVSAQAVSLPAYRVYLPLIVR